MTKSWPIIAAPALALIALIGAGCRPQPAGAAGAADTDDGRVVVETLTPVRGTLERSTTQPATVHAWFEAHVFAKVSGYLSELNVDIGTPVKSGDVLAVIDVPEMIKQREAREAGVKRLKAEERRAEAQSAVAAAGAAAHEARTNEATAETAKSDAVLSAAGIELERVRALVDKRAVAERLLDEATKKHEAALAEKSASEAAVTSAKAEWALSRAQIDAAQAELEVAQAMTDMARRELDELNERLKYTRLISPFDGVVTKRNVDLGDLVRNTQTGATTDGPPLFVVTQVDKVRVRVAVPERDAPLAAAGDNATMTFSALPGETFEGPVARVSGVLDESTRTMLVEIDLPNPRGKLLPGMFGQATIALETSSGKITLPAGAVRHDERGDSFVYVVNAADEIEVVPVRTGLDDGKQIEIVDGLTGDERVAAATVGRLQPGQKVRIQD